MQGTYGAQKRSVHGVHEHSSTGVTQQLPTGVEFRKRSIVLVLIAGKVQDNSAIGIAVSLVFQVFELHNEQQEPLVY